ncbi:MAG TPA: GNAT family N-acetyltransferase [Nocardioides sp.]
MALHTRRLGPDDSQEVLDQSLALGVEAFGPYPAHLPRPPMPEPGSWPDGVSMWATFDDAAGDPRMVARVRTHAYASWWGGAAIATCGYGGVVVAAEHRGAGLLTDLFASSLREAAERGDAMSGLFPTAPGIYRKFGYEVVTAFDTVQVPLADLAGVRPAPSVRVRRGTAADEPTLAATYDLWAREQNGPLTRRGPLFATPPQRGPGFGVTIAEEAAPDGGRRTVGYVVWEREAGYGADKHLLVHDLVALTGDAARALWKVIASFSSVTGSVRLETSDPDAARLVLPSLAWDRVGSHPYMVRVIDVPGALLPRSYAVDGTAVFEVVGDALGLVDGCWQLSVSGGVASVTRVADVDAPRLTVNGLSLLQAGAQSCANLRMLGLLEGPSDFDGLYDAWFGGRQAHVRNYY